MSLSVGARWEPGGSSFAGNLRDSWRTPEREHLCGSSVRGNLR